MRLLIEILHPAHVHFFRNFYDEMSKRGHQLRLASRDKECALQLIEEYGMEGDVLSKQRAGVLGLGTELALRTARLVRLIRRWHPDAMTGIMGPSIALAGKLCRTPAVIFYDTETAQTNAFAFPLAHSVCTPRSYAAEVRGNHVTYAGYHELAYLHPSRFTFEPQRLAKFGIDPGEPYSVVRFVSWQAVHDLGKRGLSVGQKLALVERLEKSGRVIVMSEGALPGELEPLRSRGPIADAHHLLAGAQLFVGESATMASESVVLGTPSVFLGVAPLGYLTDQAERYSWARVRDVADFDGVLGDVEELLTAPPEREQARAALLSEHIDVTDWMVSYFERQFGTGR